MLEFRIERGIGNVAAGRHVEIMQHQRLVKARRCAERHRDMARIELVAEGGRYWPPSNQPRDDRHAVIAFLAIQRDVVVAEPLEPFQRKRVVGALNFWQAAVMSAAPT